MLKKVSGVILRTVKYSETSIILDCYTQELGLRTYIISGVRKKKAKVSPSLIQPMSLVDMVVYHHEDKDINRIKEVKPLHIYQQLPFNVAKGTIGLFMTEVAQKTIKEAESNPKLFRFLMNSYCDLDNATCPILNFPIWFLIHFSAHLGWLPLLTKLEDDSIFDYANVKVLSEIPSEHHYYFSAHSTHLLSAFLDLDFEVAAQLELSLEDRRIFLQDMLAYYRYHVENFGNLNSVEILRAVFS